MSMGHVTRRVGSAATGLVTVALSCKPMSVELEHQRSAGGAADTGGFGGAANGSGAGGTSPAVSGGGASGTSQGGAGPGIMGEAGAPFDGGGATCGDGVLTDVRDGHDLLPGYGEPPDPHVAAWIADMSLSARISQMQGVPVGNRDYNDIQRGQDATLSGSTVVRGYRYRNGSRGLSLKEGQDNRPSDANNFATAFPAASIRGASWDLDLEWRVGEAIGDETAASQNNLLVGPSSELVRHPYWGRAQDAYGEDVYHVGRMGTAFVAGVQQHVGACAQHFVGNAVERERANDDAVVNEQSLREIYARPLEMLVEDGGVACVMTAYNSVNGTPASQNSHLLRDILKAPLSQGGFGFRGFVISEWWGTPGGQNLADDSTAEDNATALASAGLDVELPWIINYGSLADAVDSGRMQPDVITDAASRVLEQKARFHSALTSDGWGLEPSSSALSGASIATNEAHLELAERAELESAVLLENGSPDSPVLPIPGNVQSIAVIGADVPFTLVASMVPASCGSGGRSCTFQFATDVALGDRGTNGVNADPDESVGPFAGISAAAAAHGGVEVTHESSAAAGADADLLVVVVGLTPGDEGEEYTITNGGDRSSLALPASQEALVNDALSLMKPTVIVIESGSIVGVPWLDHENRSQATIWAGYGGMRAGAALGKLLFGDASFSGKLPLAWPAESVLPAFKDGNTASLEYFVGYREYDRRIAAGEPVDLAFSFGHGLSYTTFGYENLVLPCTEVTRSAVLDVTADVTNTGSVNGDEVAFLFVAGPGAAEEPRSQRELESFARVSLAPGDVQTVHLPLRLRDLEHWSSTTHSWVLDPGEYTVFVGSSAASQESHAQRHVHGAWLSAAGEGDCDAACRRGLVGAQNRMLRPAETYGKPMRTVAPMLSENMKRPPPQNTNSTPVSESRYSQMGPLSPLHHHSQFQRRCTIARPGSPNTLIILVKKKFHWTTTGAQNSVALQFAVWSHRLRS